MSLVDESVTEQTEEEVIDDGFINYPNHRLFIKKPDFDDGGYIDLSPLLKYLNVSNPNEIMQSVLVFADKEILSKDEVEQVFRVNSVFAYMEHKDFYNYDTDLQHILHLVRTYHYKDDGELLSDHTIDLVKQTMRRINLFRRAYEYDNTYLPYGHYKKLYTNLAKFFYIFEPCVNHSMEEIIQQHEDIDRPIRKEKNIYAGDYSVMYNPLLNKLFLWDFSKEHMAELR